MWVLLGLFNGYSEAASISAEFNTQEACMNALRLFETVFYIIECVPKG